MSNRIKEFLDAHKVLILDGGLATEIQDRGYNLNDELWSAKVLIEDPDIIEQVHYEYFKAGADVAITASYQASIPAIEKRGFSEGEAEDLIAMSVYLAKKARKRFWAELPAGEKKLRPYPMIAGSVGPLAASFSDGSESRPYAANVTERDFIYYHKRRLDILIRAGVDIIAAETLPSLAEAEAILKMLSSYPDMYAWLSFRGATDYTISEGTSIADCAKVLDKYAQVAAIGVNCVYPRHVSSLIKAARANTSKPVVIYPNAGDIFDEATKEWKPVAHGSALHEQGFAESAERWYNDGARIIGGCCRTTPADINAIYKWAAKYRV